MVGGLLEGLKKMGLGDENVLGVFGGEIMLQ